MHPSFKIVSSHESVKGYDNVLQRKKHCDSGLYVSCLHDLFLKYETHINFYWQVLCFDLEGIVDVDCKN